MLKTSGNHKNGGLYNNFFEKIEFQKKKCGQKWDENFEKLILRKFFCNNFYFFYVKFECRMFSAFI